MKRSSSWKNLQRTFASTPITSVKRAKINRKKTTVNSSKSSLDESNDFQIEDSDEENVPSVQLPPKTPLKTPLKTPKPSQRPKSKPLLINTSLNSTTVDDSVVWSSEESLDDEPVLKDVSECRSNPRPKARSKSLLFLQKNEQKQLSSTSRQRNPLKNTTPIRQPKANHKSVFNNTTNSRPDLNETIIDSDSLDENDSPKKSSQKNVQTEIITRQHSADIVFTQSTITQNSNPPVIESESSPFSLQIESPNPHMQTRRTKKKKYVKGGMAERLLKLLNTQKSEYSYWINERTADVIEPGEKMRINKMELSYGRALLHCSSVENSNIQSILCVDPSFKKLTMLQTGKTIEVGLDSNGYDMRNGTYFYPNVTKISI